MTTTESTGIGSPATGAEFDVVIRGGTVFDGTGAPGVRADVGIRDGVVAAISTTESFFSKPSISTSSWFRVCSRSSCPPPTPAPR